MKASAIPTVPDHDNSAAAERLIRTAIGLLGRIPDSLIALLGRFSIAAVFWKSGQTKVQGFAIYIVGGEFQFGVPRLSDSVVALFRDEYRLPLLSPELAAPLAAFAEHLFPLLILLGLATRFSALALLVMTLTIQLLVYPDAYPTHGVWAAVLLFLIAKGPGAVSIDRLIERGYARQDASLFAVLLEHQCGQAQHVLAPGVAR